MNKLQHAKVKSFSLFYLLHLYSYNFNYAPNTQTIASKSEVVSFILLITFKLYEFMCCILYRCVVFYNLVKSCIQIYSCIHFWNLKLRKKVHIVYEVNMIIEFIYTYPIRYTNCYLLFFNHFYNYYNAVQHGMLQRFYSHPFKCFPFLHFKRCFPCFFIIGTI